MVGEQDSRNIRIFIYIFGSRLSCSGATGVEDEEDKSRLPQVAVVDNLACRDCRDLHAIIRSLFKAALKTWNVREL